MITTNIPVEDAEIYQAWKQELEEKGVSPEELLARYEAIGMADYVMRIRSFIQKMEGFA